MDSGGLGGNQHDIVISLKFYSDGLRVEKSV